MPHLVIEVVERGFVFRKMAEVTFRKVPHPQLIPENDRDGLVSTQTNTHTENELACSIQIQGLSEA